MSGERSARPDAAGWAPDMRRSTRTPRGCRSERGLVTGRRTAAAQAADTRSHRDGTKFTNRHVLGRPPAPGRGSDVTSRRANRSAPGTPVPAGDTRGYHSTHRLSAERIHDKPKQSLFTSLGARRDRHFTARRNNHYTVRRNAIVTARSCATQESLHRATQLSLHCRRHAIRIVLERTYAGALKSIGSPVAAGTARGGRCGCAPAQPRTACRPRPAMRKTSLQVLKSSCWTIL